MKNNNFNIDEIKRYSLKYNKRVEGKSSELNEKKLREWFINHRYLDKERFLLLGKWKTPRQIKNYSKNSDELIREVTKISFSTNNEEIRIKSLFILSGVSWPVASTILHFAFPNMYPIMDFRAIWSLGMKKPKTYNFQFWIEYCERVKAITHKLRQSIRTVDKALWEYSKENQK